MFVRHVVLTVCALGLLAGSPAYAQVGDPGDPNMPSDPNEIAARCLERVTNIAEHAVTRIEEVVAHGLDAIEVLMEAGEERAAQAVARHTIHRVHRATRRPVFMIHRTCNHSVRAIEELGGSEELIASVRAGCQEQGGWVVQTMDDGIHRLANAANLPPPDEDQPPPNEEDLPSPVEPADDLQPRPVEDMRLLP